MTLRLQRRVKLPVRFGVDYACVERQAVDALNPEICRLVGIGSMTCACRWFMKLPTTQPFVTDLSAGRCAELPGILRPLHTASPGIRDSQPTQTPFPTSTPSPSLTLTSPPTPTASPTPQYTVDLSSYDPAVFRRSISPITPVDRQGR